MLLRGRGRAALAGRARARAASTLSRSSYDVVIVGGGMVGATLANALARGGLTRELKVALLEGTSPAPMAQRLPSRPGLRVSAVSHASRRILDGVGAWERVAARRATPYSEMRVWDWTGAPSLHWTAADAGGGEASLGHMVENDVVQVALYEAMMECAAEPGCNFELAAPVRVESIEAGAAGAAAAPSRLRLSTGDEITARLVVGADGANSIVKRLCGLGSWGFGYRQAGVVATLRTEEAHDTAWQRFLPWGPVALLPGHGRYSSIVWSTTPEHAARMCEGGDMPPSAVLDAVNQAFRLPPEDFAAGGRLSWFHRPLPASLEEVMPALRPPTRPAAAVPPLAVELVDGPRSFPLRMLHCPSYTRPRVALVGDAAHVMHPLAGQGVNIGFGDARGLADAVARAVEAGEDVGGAAAMEEYERGRAAQNTPVLAGVHGIQRAFSVADGPVALARSAALGLFDSTPGLKAAAARLSGAV